MTAFHDHYSRHAGDYRTYRPTYPPELFGWLGSATAAHDLAWDCGTGSGQAAVALAGHFARVLGTDANDEQIRNAGPHSRVEYAVAPAERCPLTDHSTDLVTVAQALHWFDVDQFYTEVRRVCQPGALLAVWTYERASVTPAVDAVLDRFGREFVNPFWPPQRAWVDTGYRTIPFPFPELSIPQFDMTATWDLRHMLGYLGTWSATKRFLAAKGFDPLDSMFDEFRTAWGDPTNQHTIRWPLSVRVGRVNS